MRSAHKSIEETLNKLIVITCLSSKHGTLSINKNILMPIKTINERNENVVSSEIEEWMFLTSTDGTKIAYDVQGEGPVLLLLQGFDELRQIWHDFGYVERLRQHFRVVTIDRRGIGESDQPTDPGAYTVDQMLADIYAVADACKAEKFSIWGHSFGGTLALLLASHSDRIVRSVVGGSFFGRIYHEERIEQIVAELKLLYKAQQEGQLKQSGLDKEDIEWVEKRTIPALIACWQALVSWPVVEPSDIHCPLFVFSGSEDKHITKSLLTRQEELEESGIILRIFDNLDHFQEISEIDAIYAQSELFLLKTIDN